MCIMDVRWAHSDAVMEDTVARSNSSVIYENDCLCAFGDHQMSCNVSRERLMSNLRGI